MLACNWGANSNVGRCPLLNSFSAKINKAFEEEIWSAKNVSNLVVFFSNRFCYKCFCLLWQILRKKKKKYPETYQTSGML